MFAIPWSIGAVVDYDGREKFDQFYRSVLLGKSTSCPTGPVPENFGSVYIPLPDAGTVYDYFFEVQHCMIFRLPCCGLFCLVLTFFSFFV